MVLIVIFSLRAAWRNESDSVELVQFKEIAEDTYQKEEEARKALAVKTARKRLEKIRDEQEKLEKLIDAFDLRHSELYAQKGQAVVQTELFGKPASVDETEPSKQKHMTLTHKEQQEMLL
jgi:hypothetical protein